MRKLSVFSCFVLLFLLSYGCVGNRLPEGGDNKTLAVQWYKVGNEDAAAKRFDKAVKAYMIAIKLDPQFTDAYINRGNVCIELGRYKLAVGDFTTAIELKPDSAYAYHNRGYVHLKMQEYPKAIEDFSRSIELDNRSAESYLNRGKSFYFTGKQDEAMKDLNKALQLDGNLANAYNFRGLVLMSGDGKETESRAATDFRTGCEKGDPDACKNLKQLEKSLEPAQAK